MVSSKDLYRELRAALAPVMKQAGFGRLKRGFGWSRAGSAGQLIFWFQVNKWGWDERWGSNFTVEFQLAPPQALPMSAHGRRQRLGYLLEGFPELDELRRRNNAVIERLPGTLAGEAVMATLPDGTQFLQQGFKADPEPAIYGHDVWLHYYTIDDARSWAAYLAGKLPGFLSLFENETRSPQGEASVRFHQAIGRMQNARAFDQKAAILEEYIGREQDGHYRAAAQHWLRQLLARKS